MAKDVKKRFTVDLEISTGDAEKKVKQTVGNLKTILADLGSASDKFGYLKELADYLSQIDVELDRFQKKHGGEMFARIFGGLDSALRKEMEQTFGVARDQMAELAAIRAEFEQLKINGATADGLKPLEQKIKSLYETIGRLDDAKISGRGALETRLLRMESALDNFAIVFDGVRDKIKQGFGFGGTGSGGSGTGSGANGAGSIEHLSDEVRHEIDELEQQLARFEEVKNKLNKMSKVVKDVQEHGRKASIPDTYKTDLTVDAIKNLITEFDTLEDALKSGDKTSVDYFNNLARMTEIALTLDKALRDIRADSNLHQMFVNARSGRGDSMLGTLSMYTSREQSLVFNKFNEVLSGKSIDGIIAGFQDKIANLKQSNMPGDGIDTTKIQKQIDELEKQIRRYEQLMQEFDALRGEREAFEEDGELSDDLAIKDRTVNAIEALIVSYQEAAQAKKDFEEAGKADSVEYYENLTKMTRMALQLQALLEDTENDPDATWVKQLEGKHRGSGTVLSTLETTAESAITFLDNVIENTSSSMQTLIQSLQADVVSLQNTLQNAKNATGSKTGTDSSGTGSSGTGRSGAGTGNADVDYTSLESTIRSEAAALSAKLDNVLKVELVNDDIKGTIEGIRASIDQISASLDNYKLSKDAAEKQSEVDVMKANLAQLLNFVSDFNARKINGRYQQQEISAAIMSDGTISTGYGEKGSVPWDRMASSLLGNLTKSLLVDVHSHPWKQFTPGGVITRHRYANDSFSGSSGDLGAFRFSKYLGAQLSAMITGNIMRVFDVSKLTDEQMKNFRAALASVEKTYGKSSAYNQYIKYDDTEGVIKYIQQDTLAGQHKVTEIFESFMYKAFDKIGISRNRVDNEIFKKYDLTNDQQLTALAESLVQLIHASESAISPVERLKEIITQFGGNVHSDRAKVGFEAYQKGEITAAEVFNKLNGRGYTVNQDTIDSLFRIDSAHEITAVESFLTQITSALDVISKSVSGIEHNTKPSTSDNFDSSINDILALRNGLGSGSLTKGIKSIFDPLNVSEFKTEEVFTQSEKSAKAFETLLKVTFARAMNDGIDFETLQNVLTNFAIAIGHTEDALKQTELYTERTKEDFVSPTTGEVARGALENQLDELLSPTNTSALLYLLSQAKIDLAAEKGSYAHGLGDVEPEDDLADNQMSVHLQSIQSTLESIQTILTGFTGMDSKTKNSIEVKKPVAETVTRGQELSEQDLSVLHSILEAVNGIANYLHSNESADDVAKKTEQDDNAISELTNLVRSALSQPYATEATLQAIKTSVDGLYARVVQDNVSAGPEIPGVGDQTDDSYALESTLQAVKGVLDSILSAVQSDESIANLTAPLLSAVQALQNVANGIVQQQQATKSDTSVANARIANKDSYVQIKSAALGSLGDRALESEITEMKALANGIVQVTGWLKVAEDAWEGFTVQVNEANETSKLAFSTNSKAAKLAAAQAKAMKQAEAGSAEDNPLKYNRAEVEARAKAYLDLYTEQGKNATVQFKDNGRYTISILEEIGGLSKQIFQTFDENDAMIERTTATMSNKTLAKIQELQRIVQFGYGEGLISDSDSLYQQFAKASLELEAMNSLYNQSDMLADDQIVVWNEQIKLVQKLGQELQKLAAQRKDPVVDTTDLFAKNNTLRKSFGKLDFGLDTENLSSEQQQIADEYRTLNDLITKYRSNTANVSQSEVNDTMQRVAALQQEIEAYQKKYNIVNARGKSEGRTYGLTQLQNFTAKKNALVSGAKEVGLDDDSVAVKNLAAAYEKLVNAQKAFKVGEDLTTDAGRAKVDAFKAAQIECGNYARALGNIVNESKKLAANGFDPAPLADDFQDTLEGRKAALRQYVAATFDADTANARFTNGCNQMVFVVKNADGTFTEMTASINAARTAIVATAGDTKKATSGFMSFVGSIGSKFKELWVYTASRLGVDELIQAVRTGINYVREIDSALTELKKVTNETDIAYDRFLQKMSKTASVVGSTVSELTTMAAD